MPADFGSPSASVAKPDSPIAPEDLNRIALYKEAQKSVQDASGPRSPSSLASSRSASSPKQIGPQTHAEQERIALQREIDERDHQRAVVLVQADLDRMFRECSPNPHTPREGNKGQRTPGKSTTSPGFFLRAKRPGEGLPDQNPEAIQEAPDAKSQPRIGCKTWSEFQDEMTRARKKRNRQRKRQREARARNAQQGLATW